MKEFNDIVKDIKNKTFKPIYAFDGEEPYYIDLLTDLFEKKVLEPHEIDFNQTVFYGKDADWTNVVNECRSYPSFAERRIVIIKEAGLMKDFAKLESYFENPSATTILIIAYKYKKLDGRSKSTSLIKKKGFYATSDKLKDYQIAPWILSYCKEQKIKINAANAELLATYLGTDLQKIVNELEKVSININEGDEITEELIERYIGISKDYNIFQYPSALLEKDAERSFKIANYFMANAKEHPLVVVTATLYGQFAKLYQYHYVSHLQQGEIAAALKIGPFFVKDFVSASKKYNLSQTINAINLIREYNLNAIGMNVARNEIDLLKEMTAKILAL